MPNLQLPITKAGEANPYGLHHAEDFTRELRNLHEILRKQHNLSQAGDSTFPWDYLTKTTQTRHYTLGALGRFVHADHGLILARYCQFGRLGGTEWLGGPLGLDLSGDSPWRVTNLLEESSAFLPIGLGASYEIPVRDSYGWVIVAGPNLQTLPIRKTAHMLAAGDALVWDSLGMVTHESAAAGVILGRIIDAEELAHDDDLWYAEAGQVFVTQSGDSSKLLADQIQAALNTAGVPAMASQFADLAATAAGIQSTVDATQARVNDVDTRLARQIQVYSESFTGLSSRVTRLEIAGTKLPTLAEVAALNLQVMKLNDQTREGLTDVAATLLAARNQLNFLMSQTSPAAQVTALQETAQLLNGRLNDLTFLSLPDTPDSYTGAADYVVRVKTDMSGLEFVAAGIPPTGGVTGSVLRKLSGTDFDFDWEVLDAGEIPFTPAGNIAALDVQTALEELDNEKLAGRATQTSDAVNVTLNSPWTNYGSGFAPARFYRDADNLIHFEGVIKAPPGSATAGVILFTLPAGWIPPDSLIFSVVTAGGSGRIDIYISGNVVLQVGHVDFVSLAGIVFIPS